MGKHRRQLNGSASNPGAQSASPVRRVRGGAQRGDYALLFFADENLGARPARFASDAAMAKLDRVRAEYDPDGLFNSWMGRI